MTGAPFSADYTGKVVMVTGAGSGISRATALAFAAAGATVVAIDRDGTSAEATAAEAGERGLALAVDIASAEAVDAAVADIVARFGRIDVAFNGAGVGSPIGGTIVDYEDSHWDQVMGVNLRGMFFCLRAQIRQMIAQGSGGQRDGGAIVNVASFGGLRATPRAPAYIASKHGVIGLTRATALDHAAQGIRINAICPGFIGGTRMMDAFIDKDPVVRGAQIDASVPLGRIGHVDEIADVALWLCSDAARYVTGAAIMVDGGITAA